ncbi:MAG: hypothetical protein ACFE0J_17180 [Elainellaceae cyanobacterium]
MLYDIQEGRIFKSLPDQDWGIKILEIGPHGKKAVVEYVSCGGSTDRPYIGQRKVHLMEYIEQTFPILVSS